MEDLFSCYDDLKFADNKVLEWGDDGRNNMLFDARGS